MLNLNSIMVGTEQAQVMSDFYTKVFDKKPDVADEGGLGWMVGSCFFGVGAHSEVHGPTKEPSRLILNLETTEVQEEFNRIQALGATVVKAPYQMEGTTMWIATFADPDGNYFQLMSPWEDDNK